MELQSSVSILYFFAHLLVFFVILMTSILASMQITLSVLYMFNDLAVEIKIYLKVFRKKKTLGIFYNSTD